MTLSTSPETPQAAAPLLIIDGLTVRFGSTKVIEDLSFSVQPGRTVAVVGESGSGKSVTSLSVMRLADMMGAHFDAGRILFGGRDLLETSQKDMRSIRGKEIAMIFQEPMTSLNPVFTIGDQISEVLMLHEKSSKAAALAEAQRLLEMVRLPDAAGQLKRYPHQLSGGMRQRVTSRPRRWT
jgi:glutathione transport system ATP-binding protein